MNCPVCGSDTQYVEEFPWHFCKDKDCVCHDYALLEDTDSEGVKFLKETMITRKELHRRIQHILDIINTPVS